MSPLHDLGDVIRDWMLSIPLPAARALFILLPVILLIWVLRLPDSVTSPPGGARRWDENLKLGAVLALLTQIVIYSFL
jgi:hypothetical protein